MSFAEKIAEDIAEARQGLSQVEQHLTQIEIRARQWNYRNEQPWVDTCEWAGRLHRKESGVLREQILKLEEQVAELKRELSGIKRRRK